MPLLLDVDAPDQFPAIYSATAEKYHLRLANSRHQLRTMQSYRPELSRVYGLLSSRGAFSSVEKDSLPAEVRPSGTKLS